MTGWRRGLLYLAVAFVLMAGYQAASVWKFRLGFPLDDAWIHQTFARNWVERGEWSFLPGEPAAGSTGPLWSGLLSIGHVLGLQPVVWSFFLGVVTLAALGLLAHEGVSRLASRRSGWAFWGGILVMAEWHLVWAAGSGMETLLFATGVVAVLVSLMDRTPSPVVAGILAGLLVWLRPEGVTLLGPAAFVLVLQPGRMGERLKQLGLLATSFSVLAAPYLVFNWRLSGEFLPTTYFAKQAEYAVLRDLPFLLRWGEQLSVPLVGVGVVLLPWLLAAGGHFLRSRDAVWMAGVLWYLGTAFLYAWRLPVTYQHGRYLIPVIPVFLIWAMSAMAVRADLRGTQMWPRVLSRSSVLLCLVVTLMFYALGGRAFAEDVAVIESEMVATAIWIDEHTEVDAVIAAHDIGAMGYFSGRELVDMAGLISPQVIPFIRDQEALAEFMSEQRVDYFVTLAGWYPGLEKDLEVVFVTQAPFSPAIGGTNMVVYRWGPR